MQQDLACVVRKMGQHLVLTPRERHVDAVPSRPASGKVDLETLVTVGWQRSPGSGYHAAHQRLYSREQLGNPKRFAEIVVGAEVKGFHYVALSPARRQYQDWHLSTAPYCLEHLQSVRPRHVDVKQQQVERVLLDQLQGLGAIRRGVDLVTAGFQIA
jgi:hypothetical protein